MSRPKPYATGPGFFVTAMFWLMVLATSPIWFPLVIFVKLSGKISDTWYGACEREGMGYYCRNNGTCCARGLKKNYDTIK